MNLPNLQALPLKVYHANLKRVDESVFRSACPVCDNGMMLVRRSSRTMLLETEDMCLGCGQHFIYQDIDTLRDKDWAKDRRELARELRKMVRR